MGRTLPSVRPHPSPPPDGGTPEPWSTPQERAGTCETAQQPAAWCQVSGAAGGGGRGGRGGGGGERERIRVKMRGRRMRRRDRENERGEDEEGRGIARGGRGQLLPLFSDQV